MLRDGALLLLRCAFRHGPTVWILPGGGRGDHESEEACIVREVHEEAGLTIRVERLLLDVPAEPRDGTYVRWRTYLCTVLDGEAVAGGGEGAAADLIDVMWLPLRDEHTWPPDVRTDAYLSPQLRAIRDAVDGQGPSVGALAI